MLLGGHGSSQLDLFIDNIQPGTTTGDYLCLASNSEGSVEARSQVVLALPAVITTMPRNQTRLEGEKLELLCQAKALPANITYKWLFNDKPIQSLKWFESRFTIRRDGTLVIHSVHRDDQGEYKCQATNGLAHRNRLPSSGSSRPTAASNQQSMGDKLQTPAPIYAEASAHLNVEYPARISYSPPVQYLPLGLSGIIRCFVQASPPVEFFTWTLNDQQFDPNVDQNVEALKNGSLIIKQVSKQYEGKYRCAPFNKHGSAGSSAAMEVRVEEPPYFTLKPDEFYKANVNGYVKIACDGKGLPKPNVYWRKVISSASAASPVRSRYQVAPQVADSTSHDQTGARPSSNSASLLVDDEPEPDQHLYVTAASSNPGQQQQPAQQVDENHELSGRLTEGHPSSGTATGAGVATSDEQQSVISYAKLPSDRSEYKSPHLLLQALRKEDHGRYECVLENEVATLVASTMLYIEGESYSSDFHASCPCTSINPGFPLEQKPPRTRPSICWWTPRPGPPSSAGRRVTTAVSSSHLSFGKYQQPAISAGIRGRPQTDRSIVLNPGTDRWNEPTRRRTNSSSSIRGSQVPSSRRYPTSISSRPASSTS